VPELTLTKTASPQSFDTVGQIISYTFAVTNTGTLPISGPIVIDDDVASDESCPALTTVGNGNDTLDPGETINCTASHTISVTDLNTGFVTNTATATGQDAGSGTITSNADSETVRVALIADFVPDTPSGDPRVSMEEGTVQAAIVQVQIHGNSFVDLYGLAFTVLYDTNFVEYIGCDAAGSILTSSGAASIPCDDSVVGGAKFRAGLENFLPGKLNVVATKDGLVPGEPDGDGLVLTLTFEVLLETAGTALDFELGPSREIAICPQDLSPCTMRIVPWDDGDLSAAPG
jgi:hypothetical protein